MTISREKVKLDEVLKFLFSTSNKVLIKLLSGVFEEEINENEVASHKSVGRATRLG